MWLDDDDDDDEDGDDDEPTALPMHDREKAKMFALKDERQT